MGGTGPILNLSNFEGQFGGGQLKIPQVGGNRLGVKAAEEHKRIRTSSARKRMQAILAGSSNESEKKSTKK